MILETINLSKTFLRNKKEFFAIKDINFSIKKGEFVAITGPSGSGKSTLFSIISGLSKPSSGHVITNDARLSYMFQGQSLIPSFNVLDNISLPIYFDKKIKFPKDDILKLIDSFGLKGMENEFPSSLSGGEQRRVALIRAMVSNPDIIVADEPTSNLDPENSKLILQILRNLSLEGKSVLISTHDMFSLEYADSIYSMTQGILSKQ